jgi:hypothetical protein
MYWYDLFILYTYVTFNQMLYNTDKITLVSMWKEEIKETGDK